MKVCVILNLIGFEEGGTEEWRNTGSGTKLQSLYIPCGGNSSRSLLILFSVHYSPLGFAHNKGLARAYICTKHQNL